MNKSNILCEGCRTGYRTGYCIIRSYGQHSKCPCIQCLVKVMCRDTCDNRNIVVVDLEPNNYIPKRARERMEIWKLVVKEDLIERGVI